MEPIYIVAIISFLLGASGFVIARYWIYPIYQYHKLKHQIAADLRFFEEKENYDPGRASVLKSSADMLRKRAPALTSCHDYDLPNWYRIALASRKESPVEAARDISTLANTKEWAHAEKRVRKIRANLRL